MDINFSLYMYYNLLPSCHQIWQLSCFSYNCLNFPNIFACIKGLSTPSISRASWSNFFLLLSHQCHLFWMHHNICPIHFSQDIHKHHQHWLQNLMMNWSVPAAYISDHRASSSWFSGTYHLSVFGPVYHSFCFLHEHILLKKFRLFRTSVECTWTLFHPVFMLCPVGLICWTTGPSICDEFCP